MRVNLARLVSTNARVGIRSVYLRALRLFCLLGVAWTKEKINCQIKCIVSSHRHKPIKENQ